MRAARRKVVGIHGAVPAHGVPDAAVVELLGHLLKEAKAGGITGVAIAWIGAAESVHTDWAGIADSHDMVAGAAILHHRVVAAKLA